MRFKAKIFFLLGCATLVIAGLGLVVSPGYGQDEIEGDMLRGGQLYYAWDRVLEVPLPDSPQAIWKEAAPDLDFDPHSWRCVTCHGWDYRGSDGRATRAIVKRSGFPGLFGMVAESEEEITAWLDGEKNSGHDFSAFLSPQDFKDLTAFLSRGFDCPRFDRIPGYLSGGRHPVFWRRDLF